MNISRKDFLILATAICAGCRSTGPSGSPASAVAERLVDAGPAADYATDGVYAKFRAQGFFIVRQGGKLVAISALCTHRNCKLTPEPDRSFHCNCHGSNFDPAGKVTKGPATRDLPILASSTDANERLMVTVPGG